MKIAKVITMVMILSLIFEACGNKDRENVTDKELETANIEVKETQEELCYDEVAESKEIQTEIVSNNSIIDSTEQLKGTEITTAEIIENITQSIESPTKPSVTVPVVTEPATESTTTKPVQVPTEPTTTKPSHTHSWQPVYKTVTIAEAWDEPVYEDMPVYETIKMHGCYCNICVNSKFYTTDIYGNKGVNLDEAYKHWLKVDGVGAYNNGTWRDFTSDNFVEQGYCCDMSYATTNIITGYAPQIVCYTHHDAVTEMYIDYYYCADNSCGATKEGEK